MTISGVNTQVFQAPIFGKLTAKKAGDAYGTTVPMGQDQTVKNDDAVTYVQSDAAKKAIVESTKTGIADGATNATTAQVDEMARLAGQPKTYMPYQPSQNKANLALASGNGNTTLPTSFTPGEEVNQQMAA